MHEFELRKRTAEVRERLLSLRGGISEAVDALAAIEAGLDEVDARRQRTIENTVSEVDSLRSEQKQHIDGARQRGQGPGLYKALDEASDLDRQQRELLEQVRQQPGAEASPDVLRRYDELERQQLALLSDELGKFEAQGLGPVLNRYRELAGEQQRILAELLGNR